MKTVEVERKTTKVVDEARTSAGNKKGREEKKTKTKVQRDPRKND